MKSGVSANEIVAINVGADTSGRRGKWGRW